MFGAIPRIFAVLIVAALAAAKVDAATITNIVNIATISALVRNLSSPIDDTLFNYDRALERLDHGVLMNVSGEYDYDLGPSSEDFRASHRIHTHGAAQTQTAFGSSHGQIQAMTSGMVGRASALYTGARYLQHWAILEARDVVALTFDEPVNVRVAYKMGGHSGYGSIVGDGFYNFQPGDSGVLNFITSSVTFGANVGSSGYVEIDGYPDEDTVNDFPSSDSFSTPIETTMFHWAISPLDEEPVLPGKDDNKPIIITFAPVPQPDPNGGFDPIPIGTQEMLDVSGVTWNAISTKVVSDTIEGMVLESFEIESTDNPLTSLLFNDVPVDSNLTVTFGGTTQTVVAGQPIDFGAGGVESFLLAGLDPAHSSTAPDALVFGLGFAESEFASIEVRPTNSYDAADFNIDGVVDAADYTVWRDHFGIPSVAMHSQGDANGDGAVDAADYTMWRDDFGTGESLQATVVSVPEPGAILLTILALVSLRPRFRRRDCLLGSSG